MFALDVVPPVAYADPWLQPLSRRLATLQRGAQRVAYFYEEPNNSTFRYRAYNMAQVLNESGEGQVSASYFFLSDSDRFDEIADAADLLVICRSRYCHQVNGLITKFRARGKRVLFDVDDLVVDTDYAHLVVATLGLDVSQKGVWDDWFAMIARMHQTLRLCDGVITTNTFLAQKIADCSGLPVTVVPNFMNKEQLAVAEKVFAAKERARFVGNGKITLGYFSGSPSHRLDYAIVEPALADVLSERPDVEVMVVGYIDHGPAMREFGHRVSRQPFHDYVNLQRLLGTVEFNLMPLQSNAFTDCKSELKYFEAASVGTLSIASPSYTYSRAIRDGETGYLSKAHEWTESILRAIDNSEAYGSMAAQARKDALLKFGWQRQTKTILNALQLG
ncbi:MULTISPECIES: glycosyltransferase [unclassified Variovorax]|uniref:glycosyltransferase n=1 Tax=unclassified Variovorax TaxID=663243 RepID=UPI0008CDA853|nr:MULTISPECIES: glycosyltransferase [unclassified Variovorax]SEI92844.1 Glycosyl transferases group 1 [Variovorax sp. OK202]SFB84593.1 Glycosyl transferases group 1 [Variovorax sp. OK212]